MLGRLPKPLLVVAILAALLTPDISYVEAQSGCTRWLTFGSSRQEVYEVLGPPRSVQKYEFLGEIWGYGQWSTITFKNGVVDKWEQSDAPLCIRLGAAQPNAENVRFGVSKDAVVRALGTPRSVQKYEFLGEIWGYGQWSTITFKKGVVDQWEQSDVDLRLGAAPNGAFVVDGERNASAVPRYIYQGAVYPKQVEQDIYSIAVTCADSNTMKPVGPLVSPESVAPLWPAGAPDYIRRFQYQPTYPACGENGTCYGDISTLTGRPKTVYVNPYFRRDGTYVRSHYRTAPRR